jgi:hypothetical protein
LAPTDGVDAKGAAVAASASSTLPANSLNGSNASGAGTGEVAEGGAFGAFSGLTLHLPCAFDAEGAAAADNGKEGWRENPGRVMNHYHRRMSAVVRRDTLRELKEALDLGAVLDTSASGFHARNRRVAQSDYVLAFTWGQRRVKDGGTKHTWSLVPAACTRRHVSLLSLAEPHTALLETRTARRDPLLPGKRAAPSALEPGAKRRKT